MEKDYMKEIVMLDCFEGEPLIGLRECLLCHDKFSLMSIAENHDLNFEDDLAETEIVAQLISQLLEDFLKDLTYLSNSELDFLKRMISSTFPVMMDDIEFVDYWALKSLGYIFLYYFNEHIYPVVPHELLLMLKDAFTDDFMKIVSHNQNLYSYTCALTNLYGLYEIKQLEEVWNTHNKDKISLEDANDYVYTMCTQQNYFWYEDEYVISDYFENTDEYYDFLDEVEDEPYYIPTKTEIRYFSQNEYDTESTYYKKLESFLTAKNIESENVLENALYCILDACVFDHPLSHVIKTLKEEFDLVFNEHDELKTFIKLYTDLSNNTRKWILRGNMPAQLSLHQEKPFLNPRPNQKPQIENQKISRNAPCPCGSGKKYKKCCGS